LELEKIVQSFRQRYAGTPRCFRAPGRVNLIGEHTDYNDGFVFPMAIDRTTAVAVFARGDRQVNLWSQNMRASCSFSLDRNDRKRGHWSDYVAGVAAMLERRGIRLPGADLYVESTVPGGAGLSSSAAVEIASALALLSTAGLTLEPGELARLGQRAENEFVGMQCGIMDPFVSVHGVQGHALLLDCRSLACRPVPLASDRVQIVICDTRVKHELGASEYNRRREECREGLRTLQGAYPEAQALRDVTPAQFEAVRGELPGTIRKRVRHVVYENRRVLDSVEALERGDLAGFGRWMAASHESLRDDYEVSCRELDVLVEIARRLPGCLGARMTGGGFGGSTVNLVDKDAVEGFRRGIARTYEQETGIEPHIYVSEPGRGAHEWTA
jgi:galactokinase